MDGPLILRHDSTPPRSRKPPSAMSEELAPCPLRPICVCSRADALPWHRVEPFAVSGDPAAAFARLKDVVEGMERTEIVAATDDYLHAACRTRLGFVDDLECRLSPAEGSHPRPLRVARLLCRLRFGREQEARREDPPGASGSVGSARRLTPPAVGRSASRAGPPTGSRRGRARPGGARRRPRRG